MPISWIPGRMKNSHSLELLSGFERRKPPPYICRASTKQFGRVIFCATSPAYQGHSGYCIPADAGVAGIGSGRLQARLDWRTKKLRGSP